MTTAQIDNHPGVQWWNSLTEQDRAYYLIAASTAIPAVAWEVFKRQQDQAYAPPNPPAKPSAPTRAVGYGACPM